MVQGRKAFRVPFLRELGSWPIPEGLSHDHNRNPDTGDETMKLADKLRKVVSDLGPRKEIQEAIDHCVGLVEKAAKDRESHVILDRVDDMKWHDGVETYLRDQGFTVQDRDTAHRVIVSWE